MYYGTTLGKPFVKPELYALYTHPYGILDRIYSRDLFQYRYGWVHAHTFISIFVVIIKLFEFTSSSHPTYVINTKNGNVIVSYLVIFIKYCVSCIDIKCLHSTRFLRSEFLYILHKKKFQVLVRLDLKQETIRIDGLLLFT